MKTLLAGALLFSVGTGTVVMLQNTHGRKASVGSTNIAANAAFRDGLFLGQRDAAGHRTRHAAVGRWAADLDRDAFRAGYDEGYDQVLVLAEQSVASLSVAHGR